MNNARFLMEEGMPEEERNDLLPVYRQRAEELERIIEALQKVESSDYWKVLKKYEFDTSLNALHVELGSEMDTVKIYRLQGEIKRAKKYNLESLLEKRKIELQAILNKINGK